MSTTRRSMFRLVGSTIGAGLGVAVAGQAATAEPRQPDCAPGPPTNVRSVPVTKPNYDTQACVIYCSVVACNNCLTGCTIGHYYRCVSHVCGYEFNICRNRTSCSGFCLSQSAC